VYALPVFCTQCAERLVDRPQGMSGKPVPVCPRCGAVHWIDPKLAAGCLITRDERVLLVKRSIEPGYGTWVFPGGHVDRGETVEEAALRETREEAGVDAALDGLIGLYSYPGRPVVIAVFRAHLVPGSPEAAAGDETLEVGWFTAEEVESLTLGFRSSVDALGALFGRAFRAPATR
jgi:ADP-ribose pyrophosphatase YjhB (NUDIX family)